MSVSSAGFPFRGSSDDEILARLLKMPEGSSEEDLKARIAYMETEEYRKERAIAPGLDPSLSWDEINRIKVDGYRRQLADQLGMPADSTWEEMSVLLDHLEELEATENGNR